MRESIFRSRAIEEGLRYGKDRWVFLRELAQNARDAGARRIRVRTGLEDGEVMVSFEDDGTGMDYEHAREYLFRLYASSKENDESNAGKFGVGFWSVLLFEPSSILIESRPKVGAAWAVQLDGALNELSHQPCSLDTDGTRVVLHRPRREPSDSAEAAHQVRTALSQYCRHLRRNDPEASPLHVEVNGTTINAALSTAGTVQMRFRDKHVEGAVGLGERPKVELYSRGLLVWRGTLLDELRYGAKEGDGRQFPPGLAPVYVLNGHRLNVTLDRRAVIDDRRLTEVRVAARRAMRNLLHGYLDKISPRTFPHKLRDTLVGLWEDAGESGRRPWLIALCATVLVAIALLIALPSLLATSPAARLGSGMGEEAPRGSVSAPFAWPQEFHGVGVEPERGAVAVQLAYEPTHQSHYFRTVGLARLHPGLGIEQTPLQCVALAPAFRCESECLDVAVRVDAAAGPVPLPLPAGYSVDPSSVLLDGGSIGPLRVTIFGDAVLEAPAAIRGTLTYRAGKGQLPLRLGATAGLLELPDDMNLPESLASLAARAKVGWPAGPRAQWLTKEVQAMLAYDTSPKVVRRFSDWLATRPANGFLDFVLSMGRGDCDVKNTVLVAVLRKAEVPARLALGFVGEAGHAQPGLHAWVETYVEGWDVLDASGVPQDALEAASFPALPPVVPSRDTPERSMETTDAPKPQVASDAGFSAEMGKSREQRPIGRYENRVAPRPWWRFQARSLSDLLRRVALTFGCLSLMLAVMAFLLAALGRRRLTIEILAGTGPAEEIVARLIENAIFRPDLWANASDLARRELLPLRGRKTRMTLKEAFARRDKGRLWSAVQDAAFVDLAVRRGERILDGSHGLFGEVVRRLPGCIDLDELLRLVPISREDCPPKLTAALGLVEHANALLETAGLGSHMLRLCAAGSLYPIRDVDLRQLAGGMAGPPRQIFVAVVASSRAIEELVGLAEEAPNLAAYCLLELAVVESTMLRSLRPWLRIKAAQVLCERAGGAA